MLAIFGYSAASGAGRSCRITHVDTKVLRWLSTGSAGVQNGAQHDPHDPRNTTVSLASPVFGVWGANTGVGKTLISAGLANAFARQQVPTARQHANMQT